MKSSRSALPTTTSRRAFASELLVAAACIWPALAGCGGGAPLLHPAHSLPAGAVTVGAGLSSNFVLGDADREIDEALPDSTGPAPPPGADQNLVEGVIAQLATAPGLAPWVGARAGVGEDNDAGLTYTGRAVRVDGRHAFESGDTALSVGLGLSGLLLQPRHNQPFASVDTDGAKGFGADVPVIAGWRSDAELVSVWGGARGGFERLFGKLILIDALPIPIPGDPSSAADDETVDLEATRWYAGGLFGLAIGVEPVRVAVELDVTWSHTSGAIERTATRTAAAFDAWSVVPAGAVVGRF